MDTFTNDERREVAEQLRKHNGHYYEELVNMSDSDLADLIDPTCRFFPTFNGGFGCDRCYTWFQSMETKPNYCPSCGARVVDDE